MKPKNIFKFLTTAVLAILLLGSCSNDTDAEKLFDKTPVERLNAQKSELSTTLLDSEFGWKAIYFTDDTQLGGYTHLFKFSADGKVQMASDFDDDTAVYQSDYNVVLGSTVSLLFDTYNRIHLLSDSNSYPTTALRGKGYLGDFQFLYYGQENGDILFRSNRLVREIRFVKATAQDWADLSKNLDTEANLVGGINSPLFKLLEIKDGSTTKKYDFSFSPVTRFSTSKSIDAGSSEVISRGVGYTPTSIVLSPAIVVGGQNLTNFVYNPADGSFTATGTNGVSAAIKYSNAPLVLTDDYKVTLPAAGAPSTAFGYIAANLSTAPTNSPLCLQLLNEINAALPSTQKVNRVQFTFYNNGTADIMYSFTGGKATFYHRVTVTEDAVNKTIILKHSLWHNGTSVIAAQALVKNLDDKLLDPKGLYVTKESFRIQFTNTIYTFTGASSSFRITTYAFQ
ncbi:MULTISPECIES: DUF4302 domain-containing protein [unclassified Flavobacterium]|jgi:hypothetical protein|uniref:DUF4302 domain-containing protein n=1 Tax=unclassified Flavobacterium TaxID=196869 RepID=UPI000272E780|nr:MULTISPECIES: DUF4302 domain-containing protein [unclassified Flavobacterium]EJG02363.1 hypothetical protein FF52_06770 [Flavobacterium sp. F52]MXO04282.1 DUF4302 domain-containing protein [Flavobacterium sp. HBTb2-11-1]